MTLEHMEPIKRADVPELDKYKADDIHMIDYEEAGFHCAEIFSHEGSFRGYAKTKEEAIKKAVKVYDEEHK